MARNGNAARGCRRCLDGTSETTRTASPRLLRWRLGLAKPVFLACTTMLNATSCAGKRSSTPRSSYPQCGVRRKQEPQRVEADGVHPQAWGRAENKGLHGGAAMRTANAMQLKARVNNKEETYSSRRLSESHLVRPWIWTQPSAASTSPTNPRNRRSGR